MHCMILAGGKGTRLGSLTMAVNKHLLPVGDIPMIVHSFKLLHQVGFNKVLLVTNADDVGDFMGLVKNQVPPLGEFKHIYFTAQDEPCGIPDAIACGKAFCNSGRVLVLLGDNVFDPIDIMGFTAGGSGFIEDGAHIWTAKVDNPGDYGVLELDENSKPIGISEKPKNPKSDRAIVGAYMFDSRVWDIIPKLTKSDRGEYEVTDIIREYIKDGSLVHHELKGEWHDLGRSVESYYKVASNK